MQAVFKADYAAGSQNLNQVPAILSLHIINIYT